MASPVLFTTDPTCPAPAGWQVVSIKQENDDHRVIAAAQVLLAIEEPIGIGGHGRMGQLLPRIAFARRAARIAIPEYLLVDCDLPPSAGDWPDAPVRFMATTDAFATHRNVARQRGWSIADA